MNPRQQALLGTLMIWGSFAWGFYMAIQNNFGFQDGTHNDLLLLLGTKGPQELLVAGILVRLLARWRDSARLP